MLPFGDDNPRRTFPWVNYALILINILVFLVEQSFGDNFVATYSFNPSLFHADPAGYFLTIITSTFLHAGWLHLGGNMLFLWIFGDNVEDNLGHFGYLVFYLVCGVAATLSQYAFSANADILVLGASGSIAGVMGAYIVLFPGARVRVLISIFPVRVPAWLAIGVWILIQAFSGLASFGGDSAAGGVAYLAHIGGFFTGLILALPASHRRDEI
jgi:membrane associated rhomboid family serine protease